MTNRAHLCWPSPGTIVNKENDRISADPECGLWRRRSTDRGNISKRDSVGRMGVQSVCQNHQARTNCLPSNINENTVRVCRTSTCSTTRHGHVFLTATVGLTVEKEHADGVGTVRCCHSSSQAKVVALSPPEACTTSDSFNKKHMESSVNVRYPLNGIVGMCQN